MDAGFAEGLMPGSVTARMLVSALAADSRSPAALKGALEYPYGCAEQTTSKGYAALVLDAATAKHARCGRAGCGQARVRAWKARSGAWPRCRSRQRAFLDVGQTTSYVNPALTPYIVEFLLDAREAGFAVPDAVLQKALQRLSEDLLAGGHEFYGRDHRDHLKFAYQAHAGYALARVNRAPLGTLRALVRQRAQEGLKGLPLVQLGLALSMQGDKCAGSKAIAEGFAFAGDRVRLPRRLRQPAARHRADDRAHPRAWLRQARVRRRVSTWVATSMHVATRLVLPQHAGAGRAGAPRQGLAGRPEEAGGRHADHCGDGNEVIAAAKAFGRDFDFTALAQWRAVPAARRAAVLRQPGRGRGAAQRAGGGCQRDQGIERKPVRHRWQAVDSRGR
jgi:hypothetical protein